MILSYFCMAFASALVFRSLLFGSSLYESLNFLKAWTLHRHRTTFRLYGIRRMRLILDIRYILLGILLDSLLILQNGNHTVQSALHAYQNDIPVLGFPSSFNTRVVVSSACISFILNIFSFIRLQSCSRNFMLPITQFYIFCLGMIA